MKCSTSHVSQDYIISTLYVYKYYTTIYCKHCEIYLIIYFYINDIYCPQISIHLAYPGSVLSCKTYLHIVAQRILSSTASKLLEIGVSFKAVHVFFCHVVHILVLLLKYTYSCITSKYIFLNCYICKIDINNGIIEFRNSNRHFHLDV